MNRATRNGSIWSDAGWPRWQRRSTPWTFKRLSFERGGLAQFLKWWRVERKFPTDRYRHEDASTMDSSVAPFEAPDKVPLSLQSRSRLWGQCET